MLRKRIFNIFAVLIVLGLAIGVYGRFILNPLIFDDLSFFENIENGQASVDLYHFNFLELRSLPYATLTWTKKIWGSNLIGFRFGNLILHACTSLALYFLSQILLKNIWKYEYQNDCSLKIISLILAVIFLVHPMAVYAVAYLVQRTILMSTLFGILAMICYAKGSLEENKALMWMTVPFYYLSVYSKEHSIMLFPVIGSLTILLHGDWRILIRRRVLFFIAMFAISMMVLAARRGIFGTMYEPGAQQLLDPELGKWAYPLSVLTQCELFFKYLFLWIIPNTFETSIDMREPFRQTFLSWHSLYIIFFIAWGFGSIVLLLRRGFAGLLGFALLYFWLTFFTELFTVRIKEPFVIYRSYLWAAGLLFMIPVAVHRLNQRVIAVVFVPLTATLILLTMERLITFSDSILLWSDARQLVEKKSLEPGSERIFYNLAVFEYQKDYLKESEENLLKAIAIAPNYPQAYAALGSIDIRHQQWRSAILQYSKAISISENLGFSASALYLIGRSKAYKGMGMSIEADEDYREACIRNKNLCTAYRNSATPMD